MGNMGVNYDIELEKRIKDVQKRWEREDEGNYWVSVAIGIFTFIGFVWAALIILFQ